jgi:amino acid transporter
VYATVPLGVGGVLTQEQIAENPIAFWVPAFDSIVGGASNLMIAILIAGFLLAMNAATADGSRALYGIARDDMTVKQLYHLNKRGVPGRAMTIDMVVNLALIFFVTSPLAILVAGNLGYMAAHFFAITGFILLRKDRPNWPRPIKLPSVWIPIAVILAALNALFIVVGATSAGLSGYGGKKELWIGVGVLLFSILLYIYRRVVQDKARVTLREEAPTMPPGEPDPTAVVARGSAR